MPEIDISFDRVHYLEKSKISTGSIFSSPCQRQCELLPSFGVRRPSKKNIKM
jgi:hypothetical protein